MSAWTHPICEECWKKKNPDRPPHRLIASWRETCCYCGKDTHAGIYVRDDPKILLCKGVHPEEK